jgi:hypothetical protein
MARWYALQTQIHAHCHLNVKDSAVTTITAGMIIMRIVVGKHVQFFLPTTTATTTTTTTTSVYLPGVKNEVFGIFAPIDPQFLERQFHHEGKEIQEKARANK